MSITPKELIEIACDNLKMFRMEQWERIQGLCESPIEELFLASVFSANIDNPDPVHIYAGPYSGTHGLFEGTHLWPQAKVGSYRLDFLFAHIDRNGRKLVAVECDGHNFHERTKEQAARDKSRDRYLASQGITVLRFTGSEIYRDPICSWTETLNVLWGASPE
jgi:very-short-patch-repair endonuclease